MLSKSAPTPRSGSGSTSRPSSASAAERVKWEPLTILPPLTLPPPGDVGEPLTMWRWRWSWP